MESVGEVRGDGGAEGSFAAVVASEGDNAALEAVAELIGELSQGAWIARVHTEGEEGDTLDVADLFEGVRSRFTSLGCLDA